MDFDEWTTAGALDGRYLLRATLGAGHAATVHAADDVRLRRRVAVKLYHDRPGEDELTRLAGEARVLAGLSHPGLVTVYDVCLDSVQPYLVMRLIPGFSMRELVRRDALEPADVARLSAHLADVLDYVHARGVVHGDIDTSNVLVDAEGSGYLTGFGVARGLAGPAGDVHSLGTMLAGCLPEDLGPEWQTVLAIMTDPDPAARPDAARSAELLRNLAAGATAVIPLPRRAPDIDELPPAERPTVRVAPAPVPRRVRAAHAGLAGVGLAATALAVLMATSSSTGSPEQPAGDPGTSAEQPTATTATTAPPGQESADPPVQPAGQRPAQPAPRTATPPAQTYPKPPPEQAPAGEPADNSGPGKGSGKGPGKGKPEGG